MNMDSFNEIEKKYNLLYLNINGYYFWNYSRARIKGCFDQEENKLGDAHTNKKSDFLLRLKNRVRQMKNVLQSGKIPDKDCDILILNHPRKVLVDGLFECIYTDELAERYSNSIVLEENYQGMHYQPAKTQKEKLIYTDFLEIKSFWHCAIQQRLFPTNFKDIKENIYDVIKKPLEELNSLCKTSISVDTIVLEMLYGYFMYQTEYNYYQRVLKKLKPKVIVEVVSYSRGCMVINELAKGMNIPTIELQHGTIGKEHEAYNYPEGIEIKQFPDYIFLFSEYWKEVGARMPIPEENRIAVGYPYLEKMAAKYSVELNKNRGKKNILFLSSGPIGDKLSGVALELTEKLDMTLYHIIYKLHPGEYATWTEMYPELLNSSVEVIDNNRTNLYELYAISDIQVSGYNSTTVFEGLYFDLETYILDYCVSKEIVDLCEQGIAIYFKSAGELAEKIMNTDVNSSKKGYEFWKKDGLHNIMRELNDITEK